MGITTNDIRIMIKIINIINNSRDKELELTENINKEITILILIYNENLSIPFFDKETIKKINYNSSNDLQYILISRKKNYNFQSWNLDKYLEKF